MSDLALRPTGAVLEVGCGAGRDGVRLKDSGWRYAGVDVSRRGVQICRNLGLDALVASATHLPFADASLQATWSMSTLMHLDDEQFESALAEMARVLAAGSTVAIGVWGATTDREWTSPDGRYFRHRSDERLQQELGRIGTIRSFETWDERDDGARYQFVRLDTD